MIQPVVQKGARLIFDCKSYRCFHMVPIFLQADTFTNSYQFKIFFDSFLLGPTMATTSPSSTLYATMAQFPIRCFCPWACPAGSSFNGSIVLNGSAKKHDNIIRDWVAYCLNNICVCVFVCVSVKVKSIYYTCMLFVYYMCITCSLYNIYMYNICIQSLCFHPPLTTTTTWNMQQHGSPTSSSQAKSCTSAWGCWPISSAKLFHQEICPFTY